MTSNDKKSRAILIDAKNRIIKPIVISNLKDMQNAVGGYIERAHTHKNNDFYVDEEGLLKRYEYGFSIIGAHQPFFVGNGLVIGIDYNTCDNTNTTLTIDEVKRMITFIPFKVKKI